MINACVVYHFFREKDRIKRKIVQNRMIFLRNSEQILFLEIKENLL